MSRSNDPATNGYGSDSFVRPELDLSTLMVLVDEDKETSKGRSDDGMSYEGTVVRGGLRRDESE